MPHHLVLPLGLVFSALLAVTAAQADDLSYSGYSAMGGPQPLACLMAYPADKTGDHQAAVDILESCVAKGNVWSMIWLAMLYENGQGVPKDIEKSASLMRQAAALHDEAGYATLARYHWGVALFEGRGTAKDEAEGIKWLRMAAEEGDKDARAFLQTINR